MEASRLSLRLFVEGHEIPVIGATCSFADGAPATAQIQVVATDQMWEIEPRALVCLFYYHSGSEGMGVATSGEGSGYYRWGDDYRAPWGGSHDPRHWKLLFMGTLVGIGFSKNGSSRNGVLQCADPTELLDVIRQHGTNYKRGGLAQIENAFLGTNMGSQTSYTATDKSLSGNLENWFASSEVDGKMNLAAGVQRTLREMFFSGNVWYSRQFNRLRIGDIIASLQGDLSSSNLLNLKAFKKFLKERVGEQQGLITARQMVDLLLHPILYTYTTIPCPMFDPVHSNIGLHSTEANAEPLADTLGKVVCEYSNWKNGGLNYVVFKPDSQFFPAPSCNLIFPHMYESFSFSRSFTREPTRALLRTEDLLTPRTYTTAAGALTPNGEVLANPIRRTVLPRRLTDRLYAPDFASFAALMDNGSTGGYLARLHAVELPHEFFVGPTIYFAVAEGMGHYASKQSRRAYLSFFTDYLYWRVRLGSRSGSINLGFTPNIIPGYSTVIFDRAGKHFIAYVSAITHTINQSGGTTSLSLTSVREHDESFDFDVSGHGMRQTVGAGGKSQEEVIFGSLDPDGEGTKESFYDTRYGINRIGTEVYMPMFGTNSIIDHYDDLRMAVTMTTTSGGGTTVWSLAGVVAASEDKKTVANAIELMFLLYNRFLGMEADLGQFTQKYTHRPKANLVDILGFSSTDSAWSGFPDQQKGSIENNALWTIRGAEGFMSHAIDTALAAELDYESIERTTTTRRWVETVDDRQSTSFEPLVADGDASIETHETGSVREVPRQASVTTEAHQLVSYDLDAEVDARGSGVLAYVASLLYRGMRG